MEFKIESNHLIVGLVIIIALASVIFVIVALGQSHNWFSKKITLLSYFDSAAGLSNNMAVQYKGFTIGNVKSFDLIEDNLSPPDPNGGKVKVEFVINKDYTYLARKGSIVELKAGLIPQLGNQFMFYPGIEGQQTLDEGEEIPIKDSTLANEYINDLRIATITPPDDQIGKLLDQLNTTLAKVNPIIADLGAALGPGTKETQIGRTVDNLATTVNGIPKILDDAIVRVLEELRPLLTNVYSMVDDLKGPDGLIGMLNSPGGVFKVVDNEGGELYASLVESLGSLSGTLNGLDVSLTGVAAFLTDQLPKIADLLTTLKGISVSVDELLEGLNNENALLYLLRDNNTARPTEAISPRNIRFFGDDI